MANPGAGRAPNIFIDEVDDSSDDIPSPSPFSPETSRPPKRPRLGGPSSPFQAPAVAVKSAVPHVKRTAMKSTKRTSSSGMPTVHVPHSVQPPSAAAAEDGIPKETITQTAHPREGPLETVKNTASDASIRPVQLAYAARSPPRPSGADTEKDRVQQPRARENGKQAEVEEDESSHPAEIVSQYVTLEEPPVATSEEILETDSTPLGKREIETAFQRDEGDWPDDWSGSLSLLLEKIPNPEAKRLYPNRRWDQQQPIYEWALSSTYNHCILRTVLARIHNMETTPPAARRLIHWVFSKVKNTMVDVEDIIKRLAYDPQVLQEDGWCTKKSRESVGATGGAFHIGAKIMWQGYEAVVIAFLHDPDLGHLWKSMWLEDQLTFDLETEELQRGIKKWNKRNKASINSRDSSKSSARFAEAATFTVEGIEHGIVLAASYHPNARHGLHWPARVMHVSELDGSSGQRKRSSGKQKVNVVFLAPYWNARDPLPQSQRHSDSFSRSKTAFSAGPLLEMDSIDVSSESIKAFPYDGDAGLNVDQLRVAFDFTGLPKNAFPRYLNSHRLALGLKTYAKVELKASQTQTDMASAALTDTHPLSIQTPRFPPAVLHLPFAHILSHLPERTKERLQQSDQWVDNVEPILILGDMLKAMEPPACWGQSTERVPKSPGNGELKPFPSIRSPSPRPMRDSTSILLKMEDVASPNLQNALEVISRLPFPTSTLADQLNGLVSRLKGEALVEEGSKERRSRMSAYLRDCLLVKSHGEDTIYSEPRLQSTDRKALLLEWRMACEHLFQQVASRLSWPGFGNGVTCIVTDSRFNEHRTSNGCVERPVRLPAALKGARLAKEHLSSSDNGVQFIDKISIDYERLARGEVIPQAHGVNYVERMEKKCDALSEDTVGAPLTDDSDEGGADTKGSRGTFRAAVLGVAAALKAVDLVVGGECVNAFCATRPPGHHAGKELHPMKTSSNGFCILNPAACAAIYAVTPPVDYGPGLRRVCVIDFDVHHGNGTQDILCSTHDPRFLYVSLHAGGSQVHGYDSDDSDNGYHTSIGSRQEIFPGRCGDVSPHKGVINIPLGTKLTPYDVGIAMSTKVKPEVDKFAPDLIILSAGFDGHRNDPLHLGGLSSVDFFNITEIACSLASRWCSGRLVSILEGGYGIPCCRPQEFLPRHLLQSSEDAESQKARPQPSKYPDLGDDLPSDMEDQMPYNMQRRLDRCHEEGFIDCVEEHIKSLGKNNRR